MKRDVHVVVGLGNPGTRYERTRHNVGFLVVDTLARKLDVHDWRTRFDAEVVTADVDRHRLVLVKPMTYMNLSGTAVREVVHWYRVPLDHLLVVYDDVDLPFGRLRLRAGGGSGGHHGVESIVAALGSDRFARLRVGIGRPSDGRTVTAHVLSRFSPEEEQRLPNILDRASEAVLVWCRDGLAPAMNRFNRVLSEDRERVALRMVRCGEEDLGRSSPDTRYVK